MHRQASTAAITLCGIFSWDATRLEIWWATSSSSSLKVWLVCFHLHKACCSHYDLLETRSSSLSSLVGNGKSCCSECFFFLFFFAVSFVRLFRSNSMRVVYPKSWHGPALLQCTAARRRDGCMNEFIGCRQWEASNLLLFRKFQIEKVGSLPLTPHPCVYTVCWWGCFYQSTSATLVCVCVCVCVCVLNLMIRVIWLYMCLLDFYLGCHGARHLNAWYQCVWMCVRKTKERDTQLNILFFFFFFYSVFIQCFLMKNTVHHFFRTCLLHITHDEYFI